MVGTDRAIAVGICMRLALSTLVVGVAALPNVTSPTMAHPGDSRGALANEYAAEHPLGAMGFIDPASYEIEAIPFVNAETFHAMTVGNRPAAGSIVGYSAGSGGDDASGWGTPNVADLAPMLAVLTGGWFWFARNPVDRSGSRVGPHRILDERDRERDVALGLDVNLCPLRGGSPGPDAGVERPPLLAEPDLLLRESDVHPSIAVEVGDFATPREVAYTMAVP